MTAMIRHALRSLRKAPAFTLTVIATLAVGIGLNAAIFAVVDNVLLRPLAYKDADRIVGVQTHFVDENRSIARLGGEDYNDLSKRVKGLEATAYYQSYSDGISLKGDALYLPVAAVSPQFFTVMGVQPIAGRLFRGSDTDAHDAVVIQSFAQEHFGSASAAVGQVIEYGGSHTIVGVVADAFTFPRTTHVWMEEAAADSSSRTSYSNRVIGKRRADVAPAQLAAELATFSSQLQQAYIEDAHKTIEAVPLQEQIVGRVRPMLNLLMGSVAVLLLIIIANLTHLQLVRATEQLRSVTIRTALGASRGTLATRALVEATMLAAGGSIAAALLAVPALRLLVRLAPADLPRIGEVHLNADVFMFSFLLSLVVMAVTALLPVWRSWQVDPSAALRQDAARGGEGRGAIRLRDGLIVAEVALTLTLSVTAIMLTRQLIAESRQYLGFSAESLVTLDMSDLGAPALPYIPRERSAAALAAYQAKALPIKQQRIARLNSILESMAKTPGVVSVAAMTGAPMAFWASNVSYAVKGRQLFTADAQNLPNAEIRAVTPETFTTLGIPLVRGRALNETDRADAPPVLLIDATLARTIFPNEDPIGRLVMCGYDDVGGWWTIVGVVGAIHSDSPGAVPTATFYVPVAQHPAPTANMQLVFRVVGSPSAMAETLPKTLQQTYPQVAVKATTMRENIGETQRTNTFRDLLFGCFSGVSLLLAAVGMYGVTAYSVTQRKFEFGLRVALGANQPQLFGMVLRKALAFALVGVGLGIGLSVGMMRVLASVVGKLPAFDPAAYALASVAVMVVAVIAMFLPARAAARVDPMDVLRGE